MTSLPSLRMLLLLAAGLFFSAEPMLAQGGRPGGGTGKPSFPPGLHDRTLPPGRPFDGGGFDPPGRAGNGPPGARSREDVEELAGRLARLLDDERFPDEATLPPAVDAYNELVLALSSGLIERPPAAMIAGQRVLPPALGQVGVQVASVEGAAFAGLADDTEFRLLPGGTVQVLPPLRPWTMPGMAASNPIGFGAGWGTVWAGASYQPKVRYNDGEDGAVAVGFGLGDPRKTVGLQVGINSFSTVRSGLGNRVGIDLHLHKAFGLWGVAVGVESLGSDWSVTRDSGKNLYAVGSRWLQLRSDPDAPFGLAMVSLGVGSGRFQLEEDFYARSGGVGVFGSVGVRVLQPVSFVAEWTGQDLMLAGSVAPLQKVPLAITAGFTEVTGAAGDGARFVVGASLGWSFR